MSPVIQTILFWKASLCPFMVIELLTSMIICLTEVWLYLEERRRTNLHKSFSGIGNAENTVTFRIHIKLVHLDE